MIARHGDDHAVVLVEAERNALSTLAARSRTSRGSPRPYSVTGEWDFVAIIRSRPRQLADVVTRQIGEMPGVARTQTMVAFAAYSQHDLDALFSVGG